MEKRILKICSAKELPYILDRKVNYLYLLYDKLLLFFGQNPYYDPYVICEKMPDDPITGCLYILFDGSVKSYIKDEIIEIATIEDPLQLSYLKTLGTTYFIMADKRYLDIQHRTLQLPYHNGTYSMTVSLAKNLKINDKTIVRYNAEKERFYIDGEYDGIPDFRKYKGKTTKSVALEINNHCIHANLRLSSEPGNILKIVNGGLYASVNNLSSDDILNMEEFTELRESYEKYKSDTEQIINSLSEEISKFEIISDDSIFSMVKEAVSEYYSDIDKLLAYYNTISDKLKELEINSKNYTDKVFEEKVKELQNSLGGTTVPSWGEF